MQKPLSPHELSLFEQSFDFQIRETIREFILANNGARLRTCNIPTDTKERRIAYILDFTENGNAWEVNQRMRKLLGSRFLVVGTDRSDNFLCICRNMRQQELVIWNHVTDKIEACATSTDVLLLQWRTGGNT